MTANPLPAQKPPVRSAIVRGTRCGVACPESLSGSLKGLKCSLETTGDGRHAGDHRTSHTIHRVGKVKFSWKNKNRATGPVVTFSSGPPVIDLREDATQNPYLTGVVRKVIECECPSWWIAQGSKMHHSPCRLI